MRVYVYASAGIFLLMVGCVLPKGMASMRKPVMVSTLERHVSVKEVSFTSEIRTRRGGLTSALRRKENSIFTVVDLVLTGNVLIYAAPVTFQCGCLSFQWSAGDRVLQSVDMYLVCCCHLQ